MSGDEGRNVKVKKPCMFSYIFCLYQVGRKGATGKLFSKVVEVDLLTVMNMQNSKRVLMLVSENSG